MWFELATHGTTFEPGLRRRHLTCSASPSGVERPEIRRRHGLEAPLTRPDPSRNLSGRRSRPAASEAEARQVAEQTIVRWLPGKVSEAVDVFGARPRDWRATQRPGPGVRSRPRETFTWNRSATPAGIGCTHFSLRRFPRAAGFL